MAGDKMVLLDGAPDALIGTSEAKASAVQIMHLEMDSDMLHDVLECVRKGKTPHVLFGKLPVSSLLPSRPHPDPLPTTSGSGMPGTR